MYGAKQFYPQVDNTLQGKLVRIKEIEHFSIEEINDKDMMRKTLNKYITIRDYADRNLLVLSGVSSGVSLC